jgi:hypothetical protein
MEEMDLWSIVEGKARVIVDPQQLAQCEKKVAKVKRPILDFMKDHLDFLISWANRKEMYEALTSLYQSDNVSSEVALEE